MANEHTQRIMQAIENSQRGGSTHQETQWETLMRHLFENPYYRAFPDSTPLTLEEAIGKLDWVPHPIKQYASGSAWSIYSAVLPGISPGIKLSRLTVTTSGELLMSSAPMETTSELTGGDAANDLACVLAPLPEGLYLKDDIGGEGNWRLHINGVDVQHTMHSTIILGPTEQEGFTGEVVRRLCPGNPIEDKVLQKPLPLSLVSRIWLNRTLPTTVREAEGILRHLTQLRFPLTVQEAVDLGFEYACFEGAV